MILRRAKVSNWRAIDEREVGFGEGLTLLAGLNERGKSSLVEAIEWGLYQKPKQRWRAEDLQALVPVSRPTALPSVELDVQVGNLLVTAKKVFAPEARRRSCEVIIRRDGRPLETITDIEAAQARFEELLGASGSMASVAVGRQGEPSAFIAESLPSPARNALTINREGVLLPSARLERARELLTEERNRLLSADLRRSRAGTEGAQLEAAIQQKEAELEEARRLLTSIDGLRQEIARLRQRLAVSEPQETSARAELEVERQRQRDQERAEKAVAQAEAACHERQGVVQRLQGTIDQIRDLRRAIADGAPNLARAREEAEMAKKRVEELEREERERNASREAAATRLKDALRRQQALHLAREVELRSVRVEELQQAQRSLEKLAEDLDQAEKRATTLPPWPTNEEIRDLREVHRDLEDLLREARTKLQVNLTLDHPARIRWIQDAEPARTTEAGPDAPVSLGAVQRIEIVIDGVGRVDVRCGAGELVELLTRIEEITGQLDAALGRYGLRAADLLEGLRGFDELEGRRITGEKAQEAIRAARRPLTEEERRVGSRQTVQSQLQDALGALEQARTQLAPLADEVPAGLQGEALTAELDRIQAAATARQNDLDCTLRALTETQAALRTASDELAQRKASSERLQAETQARDRELTTLTTDGLSDEDRQAALHAALIGQATAEADRKAAQEARIRLGDPVSLQVLQRLEESLRRIQDQRQADEKTLHERLGELRTRCERDPEGTIQRLDAEIPPLRARRTLTERRARATALLVALLEAERRRVGRLMAGPLNEQLAPWMTVIRGARTEIELDAGGERIERVLTYRDDGVEALPFSSLSGGTKEQVALLVRVILARLIAAQNPDRREILILDDPLTQSDEARRPALYRVLRQASEHVQILFVTSHSDTAGLAPEQAIMF